MAERTSPKTGENAHRLGECWGLGLGLLLGSATRPVPPCVCYSAVWAEEIECYGRLCTNNCKQKWQAAHLYSEFEFEF